MGDFQTQQSSTMLRVTARRSLIFQRDPLSILVFHTAVILTLIHPCRGQSEVIGSFQPVVAYIGDDVVLLCHLDPVMDAFAMTVEWARPDLEPRFVLVWRDSVDLESKKHPLYDRRTSLFTHELKNGNISLKISKVKQSDEGTYRCFVPELDRYTTVQLIVGVTSSPVISLAGLDKASSKVVLQCESAGWYPEPELLWLDSEGKLLSAEPTETLRGLDDLYTVSSRVTVEKRHSNNFTCRVQQKNINQSRETHIHVPEDFFMVISPSSPPSNPASNQNIIIGLVISGAVVVLILILAVFFVWKRRRGKFKNKMMDSEHDNNGFEVAVEEGESEPLMKGTEGETVLDMTGENTNTSPVPKKSIKFEMKQETHEEWELTRKEEENDLDSRDEQSDKDKRETQQAHTVSETEQTSDICGPQEKRISPSQVIKKDKFTTEQETHEVEGGKKMEAGKEESRLKLSTCTEEPKEQQLLLREAALLNFTDAQKKPQENQREELEAEQQREENQMKLQSETRMEKDKAETELKTQKDKDIQDHTEGKKEDKIKAEKETHQDKNQPKFQPEAKPETKKVETELKTQKDKDNQDHTEGKKEDKIKAEKEIDQDKFQPEAKPETKKVETEFKRQKNKDRPAQNNQDKIEGKQGGNKEKGQKGNQNQEKKLLPVSGKVTEKTDLTVQEITPGENRENEQEEENRAQPENLRRAESKKGAQEEVTEFKEAIHTDEICRKDEEKEKLQQGQERELFAKQVQLEEPASHTEGEVACQEEPHEPMEFDENPCVDQNSIKGRTCTQERELHTDQQQTARKKNYQEKNEQKGRNFKRRKEWEEEDENDDLMEVEGEANSQEDVTARPQIKRVKFQPVQEFMCQEDQQEQMETL